jgi:sugar phosphate isomerase/epimerase
MLSLSTSWLSPRHSEGREIAQDARELGFEYIEVSHGTKITQLPGLLDAVNAGEIKISSLHNFCPAPVEVMIDAPDVFEFTSPRAWERERAISLTRKTIEMATRFGTDLVVIHIGCVPMKSITTQLEQIVTEGGLYSRKFTELKLKLVTAREKGSSEHLDRVRAALGQLLPECEKHRVRLGIETRSHYEQIPNQREMSVLMQEYRDCPWIGSWHDFGHVQRQANLALLDHEIYLSEIAPHLIGCHVHDVQWPARDHRTPLSTGGVAFEKLLPLVPRNVPLIWELAPSQKREQIIEALAAWKAAFPDRAL